MVLKTQFCTNIYIQRAGLQNFIFVQSHIFGHIPHGLLNPLVTCTVFGKWLCMSKCLTKFCMHIKTFKRSFALAAVLSLSFLFSPPFLPHPLSSHLSTPRFHSPVLSCTLLLHVHGDMNSVCLICFVPLILTRTIEQQCIWQVRMVITA